MIPLVSHLLPALMIFLSGRLVYHALLSRLDLLPTPASRTEWMLHHFALYFTLGGALLSLPLAILGHHSVVWFTLLPTLLALGGILVRPVREITLPSLPWISRDTSPIDYLLALAISVGALLGFLGALSPEVRHDSLFYHLQTPQIWLNVGRMIEVPENAHAFFPYGYEMLFTFAMALVDDSAAKVLHWIAGLVAMVWVMILARDSGNGLAAGAIYYFIPTMAYLSTTTYIDLATGMYGLAAVVFYLRLGKQGWNLGGAFFWGFIVGTAMATKYTAWALLGIPFGVLALWTFRRHPLQLMITGVGVVLLLSPWLVRNWVYVGNPVAPLLIRVFGPESAYRTGLAGAFDSFAGKTTGITDLLYAPVGYALHLIGQKYTQSLLGLLAIPLLVYTLREGKGWVKGCHDYIVMMGLLAGMFLCEALLTRGHPDGRYGLTSIGLGAVVLVIAASRASNSFKTPIFDKLPIFLALALFVSSLFDYRRHQVQLGERWVPILSKEARAAYRLETGAVRHGFFEVEEFLHQESAGRVTGHFFPSRLHYWEWIQGIRNDPVDEAGGTDAPPGAIAQSLRSLGFTHLVNGTNPGFDRDVWESFLDHYTTVTVIEGRPIHAIIGTVNE